MKNQLLALLLAIVSSPSIFASAGSGPWAMGAYYPGQLDGKYQAAVYGNNITGVVGFAVVNGGIPFSSRSGATDAAAAADPSAAASVNTDLGLDETQNYFAIFVEGRTYTGRSVGMIDIDRKKVTGTLIGFQPTFAYRDLSISQPVPFGDPATTTVPVLDNLPLLNRGLSGAFTANLKNTKNLMTFKGSGELATPAQTQTVTANPPTFTLPPLDPAAPPITLTGFTPSATSASIQTATVPFSIYGIKTSLFATDPLAAAATSTTGSGATP